MTNKHNINLVSIVMPAFNAEKYIEKSIDSVLKQTHHNWELIIINDGSTDNTALILNKFKDSRIIIINQYNRGVASARNIGIKNSNGFYVAFLDSDDIWLENKLEVQLNFMLNNNNIILSFTDYHSFSEETNIIKNKQLFPFKIDSLNERLLVYNFIATLTVMVKRSILQNNLFNTKLTGPEDWELWIRISKLGELKFINQKLSMYREHTDGISKNKIKQLENEFKVLNYHILQSENIKLKKYALWFYYLKVANFHFLQKDLLLFIKFYFKLVKLFPFKLENYTYPIKKLIFR